MKLTKTTIAFGVLPVFVVGDWNYCANELGLDMLKDCPNGETVTRDENCEWLPCPKLPDGECPTWTIANPTYCPKPCKTCHTGECVRQWGFCPLGFRRSQDIKRRLYPGTTEPPVESDGCGSGSGSGFDGSGSGSGSGFEDFETTQDGYGSGSGSGFDGYGSGSGSGFEDLETTQTEQYPTVEETVESTQVYRRRQNRDTCELPELAAKIFEQSRPNGIVPGGWSGEYTNVFGKCNLECSFKGEFSQTGNGCDKAPRDCTLTGQSAKHFGETFKAGSIGTYGSLRAGSCTVTCSFKGEVTETGPGCPEGCDVGKNEWLREKCGVDGTVSSGWSCSWTEPKDVNPNGGGRCECDNGQLGCIA